jgi:hypothetical protein
VFLKIDEMTDLPSSPVRLRYSPTFKVKLIKKGKKNGVNATAEKHQIARGTILK